MVLLVLSAAAALCLVPLGYGIEGDTWLMLASWQNMLVNGEYLPSRFQGNLVAEVLIGLSASLLGHYGTNLLALLLGVATLALVHAQLRPWLAPDHLLPALAMIAANPLWILAASTATDYIYALFLFMSGTWLLSRRLAYVAALCFACAASARLQFAPLGLAAFGFWLLATGDSARRRELMLAGLTFLFVTGLLYLPVFITYHLSFVFLDFAEPGGGAGGFAGRLARFVYKTSLLLGHPTTLAVATAAVVLAIRRWRAGSGATGRMHRGPVLFALLVFLISLAIFLLVPAKVSYLLPVLLSLPLLLAALGARPVLLVAVAVLEVAYWFVSPDVLEITHRNPEGPQHAVIAVDARIVPNLKPGVLVENVERRERYQAHYLEHFLLAEPAELWRQRGRYRPSSPDDLPHAIERLRSERAP